MSMFMVNNYTPTRVVFGAGRLGELATMRLPGRKTMIFVTADGLMEKLGIQQRVLELLKQNGVEAVVYDKITPNPYRKYVMEARDIAKFPAISIIDPELMLSLPRTLTLYQGFDALFHLSECYITNNHENRLVDVYSEEGIRIITKWLPVVAEDGGNLEARLNMSYAANILAGYTQSLINCTSHHITAQTLGGLFPKVAHGASLIMIAEEYYKRVLRYFPDLFDEMGEFMGVRRNEDVKGTGFLNGLINLLDSTDMRILSMSEYGIKRSDYAKIADMTVNNTGIEDMDRYPEKLTAEDIKGILERSYR